MNTGDWIFYYGTQMINWLNPLVAIIGLCIALRAFLRSRKCGYLVVAVYFLLTVFTLLAMPSINRAMRAHRAPEVSAQTQQTIDAADKQAGDQTIVPADHPVVTAKRHVRFPFGQIILVIGLWLLARHEPKSPAKPKNYSTAMPDSQIPPNKNIS